MIRYILEFSEPEIVGVHQIMKSNQLRLTLCIGNRMGPSKIKV